MAASPESGRGEFVPGQARPVATVTDFAPGSGGGPSSEESLVGGNLVYSNTAANLLFPPGANRRIADDLFLTELCGCRLTRLELTIGGGGDGTGPGFGADIGLYDGCPDDGGALIPGTSSTLVFPDDATRVVVIDVSAAPIDIPSTAWLAVEFDRAGAGWLVGEQPDIGFSDDIYDHPTIPCAATFSGAIYASFAAQVFCAPPGAPPVTDPIPADAATGVGVDAVLAWNGGVPVLRSPAPADKPAEKVTADTFVSGFEHPDVFLKQMKEAIRRGDVPDPATLELPEVAPRTYFGPGGNTVAGFVVPTVTPNDIFVFEDSADIIASTNFSSGSLFSVMATATNEVLAAHGDNFDFVAFFINFQPDHQIGAAFYMGIENDVSGIGLNTFNSRPAFGVAGDNVEGWVMMWRQSAWSEGYFTFTQLVLGQEFEHRFGMFLNALPGGRSLQGNNGACGRGSHWNFRVDGQGSGMEIAEWAGSSPAIRQGGTLNFNLDIDAGVFSYPDLYLMGYVSGQEMDTGAFELRYMDDNTNCTDSYSGAISTWGSQDIVATNGTRSPNFLQAQKHFSTAWVMIHRPIAVGGHLPTSSELSHVTSILNTWNDVWITSALNKGTMTNVLNPGSDPQLCTLTYDVLLDTVNPPVATVCPQTTQRTCDPGGLAADESYFWRVAATNDFGTTQGPVWSFSTTGGIVDCNGNGIPDDVDIAQGTSTDCNGNAIPDECDLDGDGDGVPDDCDPCPLDNPDDSDGDGVCDSADICPGGNDGQDTDGDLVPDFCDVCPLDNPDDSDGDGVCDSADICPGGNDGQDTDGDLVPDFCDVCPLDNPDDSDGDGVCDSADICPGGNDGQDTDGDLVPDFCDVCPLDNPDDSDGDGVCDSADICPGGNDGQDTDGDLVPDFCDVCPLDNPDDSDGDGICDSADNCGLFNPDQLDCQPNSIGDVCDINDGTSTDKNLNGIPDECEAAPPAAPSAEDVMLAVCGVDEDCAAEASCIGGVCYVPKNRYLSIAANAANSGLATARRIRLIDNGLEVHLGWVGPPVSLVLDGPETNPVLVSGLTAQPFYVDWTQQSSQILHVGACAISPGHRYRVESIAAAQDIGLEANYSLPLDLPTVVVWGDVVGGGGAFSPPDTAANLIDVQAVVFGFQALQTVTKIRLELAGEGSPGNVPDVEAINFDDILRAVQGFQGNGYPFSAPLDCL